jgi:biopolymer transport protein ExbD
MRIEGAKRVHYESGPNMTPLVDVVMVILIFLMLTGSFIGAEHFLSSNLPLTSAGGGAQELPEGFIPDEPLEIRVDSPTPGRFLATAGQIRTDNIDALTAQLDRMRQQLNGAGKETDKIQVKIGPARNVKYRDLVQVYEAAMRAGFTKIAFATSHS